MIPTPHASKPGTRLGSMKQAYENTGK